MKQLRQIICGLLCLLSFITLFQVPAYAERQPEQHLLKNEFKTADAHSADQAPALKQAGPTTTKVVDFSYLYWYGLVAVVKGDGSVVAVETGNNAEGNGAYCQSVIESWTNIVQIDNC